MEVSRRQEKGTTAAASAPCCGIGVSKVNISYHNFETLVFMNMHFVGMALHNRGLGLVVSRTQGCAHCLAGTQLSLYITHLSSNI